MATAVPVNTKDGTEFFSVTGSGTPEDPFVLGLTTSAPTGSVYGKTFAGAAYFGVTGAGTPASPYLLCVGS